LTVLKAMDAIVLSPSLWIKYTRHFSFFSFQYNKKSNKGKQK